MLQHELQIMTKSHTDEVIKLRNDSVIINSTIRTQKHHTCIEVRVIFELEDCRLHGIETRAASRQDLLARFKSHLQAF